MLSPPTKSHGIVDHNIHFDPYKLSWFFHTYLWNHHVGCCNIVFCYAMAIVHVKHAIMPRHTKLHYFVPLSKKTRFMNWGEVKILFVAPPHSFTNQWFIIEVGLQSNQKTYVDSHLNPPMRFLSIFIFSFLYLTKSHCIFFHDVPSRLKSSQITSHH